jgi:hypothetical protein
MDFRRRMGWPVRLIWWQGDGGDRGGKKGDQLRVGGRRQADMPRKSWGSAGGKEGLR